MLRYAAKITSKGQVTIPKAVRDLFRLETGDYLIFEPQADCIVVSKAPLSPTEDFDALADLLAQRFSERGIAPPEPGESPATEPHEPEQLRESLRREQEINERLRRAKLELEQRLVRLER